MISSSSSSEKSTFTAALGHWSSMCENEQHEILNRLSSQALKAFLEGGLSIPDASFLDFAVRAGLHNFQIHVAAGIENDTAENCDRFCTDFVLKLVAPPKAADNYH
jgi:hypothetical protein